MTTYQTLLQNPEFKKKSVLEALIREYTKMSREDIWLNLEQEIESWILTKILQGYHEYTQEKKPLEYILGHVDFFGKEFFVNENTIIPRPETEYMVRAVSEYLSALKTQGEITLLDIGTGSGILWISVILQYPEKIHQIFLSDISEEALEVAKKNRGRLVENYTGEKQFLKSNLAEFLKTEKTEYTDGDEIILVANLPYIPDETFDNNALENVQKREPRLAFVGGDDGLDFYREMFEQIKINLLEKKEIWFTMFLEMMTRQVDILKQEFSERLTFQEVETFHFNIRIVKVQMK